MEEVQVPNPWKRGLAYKDGDYVLEEDADCIKKLRDILAEGKDDYKLHLELYPEPFIGEPEAEVYLLSLNPGYDSANEKEMLSLEEHIKKNYSHEKNVDYPFYYLREDLFKKGIKGSKWWRNKFTKDVLKKIKGCTLKEVDKCKEEIYKQISKNIFCIEYFPYHSKKADGKKISKYFESAKPIYQIYNKYLINKAIDMEKIIIITRSEDVWYKLVPRLKDYVQKNRIEKTDKVFFCGNPRSIKINENNVLKKEGFENVIEKLKA